MCLAAIAIDDDRVRASLRCANARLEELPEGARLDDAIDESRRLATRPARAALPRHRLEQRRWLTSEWRQSDTGREAKFYRLTRKGRSQLETEAAGWQRLTEAVTLILNLSEA